MRRLKNSCRTRHRSVRSFGLLLVLGALLGSCAGQREPGIGGDGQPIRAFKDTEQGTFSVRWASIPHPIPINEPFELVLEVLGPDVNPLLEADGWMPGHGHGMVRTPRVTPLGEGSMGEDQFQVKGMLFHMEGAWELRIAIAWRQEQGDTFSIQRESVVFEVEI